MEPVVFYATDRSSVLNQEMLCIMAHSRTAIMTLNRTRGNDLSVTTVVHHFINLTSLLSLQNNEYLHTYACIIEHYIIS